MQLFDPLRYFICPNFHRWCIGVITVFFSGTAVLLHVLPLVDLWLLLL